jgi:hypothetical protein
LAEFAFQLLNSPAIGVVGTAIGVWLKGRYSRKARLKFSDVDVEASTPAEIEQLLKSAAEYHARIKTIDQDK